jgi:hypothetical protein
MLSSPRFELLAVVLDLVVGKERRQQIIAAFADLTARLIELTSWPK